MSKLRLIIENHADSATLTASPAVLTTLPVSNLQLSPRAKVMRTSGLAAQQISGAWPQPKILSGCALWRHNLSSAGTWRLQLYADAACATRPLYDSGDVVAWPAKALGDLVFGVDPLGATVFTGWGQAHSSLWFTPVVAGSFRLTLTDPTNADGYIEAARLFLGMALEPAYNPSWGHTLEWRDESKQTRTDGGSLRSESVAPYRALKLQLEWLTDTDRPKFLDIGRTLGKRKDLFISLYPNAGGMLERDYGIAAKVVGSLPATASRLNAHAMELELEET